MDDENTDEETIHLEVENELQFTICEPREKITIQLVTGSAEIFGSELQISTEYEFSYFSSVAIFTWHGCTLKLRKEASSYIRYKIKSSRQIPKMRDLHEYLKEIRSNADINNADCPITLVIGPCDVGKSTLCRFLLNYAARDGRRPIFIDLDVGQSSLSITGTFGVLPVQEPSDVKGRFNKQALSVYYFGYKSPGDNMILYKLLIEKLRKTVATRLKQGHHTRNSGVLINTCGWVDKGGYKIIKDIIGTLDVNIVLVLSENSLYSRLKNDVPRRTEIIYMEKFRDVVTRNRSVRIDNRNKCVYEYFYGSSRQLQPYAIKVNFNDLQIFKANYSRSKASNVISVLIEPNILYQVLALSYADDIERIPLSSIYGFICITEIDMDAKIMTVLSPQPSPLPTNYVLMGDVTLTAREITS